MHPNPIDNLVTMANQIGAFFETMPERDQALTDFAQHLRRSWAPRMRATLLQHVADHPAPLPAETGLMPFVLTALALHHALLRPPATLV